MSLKFVSTFDYLEGHIKQVDIGHGIGHTLNTTKDVIITGVNNEQIHN